MISKQLNPYLVAPWRFLGNLIKRGESQHIAAQLHLTPQSVKSWTREPNLNKENASGRRSPLSYLFGIFDYFFEVDESPIRAHQLAEYVCVRAGGIFVALPDESEHPDDEILKNISAILKESGEAIEVTRVAWLETNPGRFTPVEKQLAVSEHMEAVAAHIRMIKLIERL